MKIVYRFIHNITQSQILDFRKRSDNLHVLNTTSFLQEYESYFKWKKYYQPSTVGSYKVFCDLCAKLYDKRLYESNTISDFHDWFVTKDYCRNASFLP